MRYLQTTPIIAAVALLLTACTTKEQPPSDSAQQPAAAATAPSSAGFGENLTPDAGGKVIEVHMMTDEQGNNKFEPNQIEAHQGDVIRFTLKTGVHNVDFFADSNTVKSGLPAASALLQLPGQTADLKVALAPGKYYFQCDPHAALGMKGRLEVEEKE
jgi:plastocyanin